MSWFKPEPVEAPTAGSLADQMAVKLQANAEKLTARREQALSTFRETVKNLRFINESLAADVRVCDAMIQTSTQRKAEAEQAIKDNEAVAQHILDIIGE